MKTSLQINTLIFAAAMCAVTSCAVTPSANDQRLSSREGRVLYAAKFTDAQKTLELASANFSFEKSETWPSVRQAISAAQNLDAEYGAAVKYSSKDFPERDALSAAVKAATKSAESEASLAFASWPLDAAVQFEQAYPVNVRLDKAWVSRRLAEISFGGQLDEVIEQIRPVTIKPVQDAAINALVSHVQSGKYGSGIDQKITNAETVMKSLGIGLVPLTFSLHAQGGAADLSGQLLIAASAPGYTIQTVASPADAKAAKGILVAFAPASDPSSADLQLTAEKQEGACKMQGAEDARSRRQVGLKKAPNPEIDRLQTEISNASEQMIGLQEDAYNIETNIARNQMRLQEAINRAANAPKVSTTGPNSTVNAWANVMNTYADTSAQSRINELQRDIRDQNKDLLNISRQSNETNADIQRLQLQLARTSSTIDVPDYAPYEYKVESHTCESKTHYKLQTRDARIVSKKTSVASRSFRIAHGIDPADPDRKQLSGKYAVSQDLGKFTGTGVAPELGALTASVFQKALPAATGTGAQLLTNKTRTP